MNDSNMGLKSEIKGLIKPKIRKTRNKAVVLQKLLATASIDSLEKLSQFGKSQTVRVLAERLLKIAFKHKTAFRWEYFVGSDCEFAEIRDSGEILAYSIGQAVEIARKEIIKPEYRRFFNAEDFGDFGISLEHYDYFGLYSYNSESIVIKPVKTDGIDQ